MKWSNYFATPVLSAEKKKILDSYFFHENIQRSRLFAKIVMVFETLLIFMNITETYVKHGTVFQLNAYLILYITLFFLSATLLGYIRLVEKRTKMSPGFWRWYRLGLLLYVTVFLIWGAAVTLVDQLTYGHVMAFAVNYICVSIMFHASTRIMLAIFIPPIIVLAVGLPFVQPSTIVLMGHYTNLFVFLVFCWIASRMLYRSYSTSYINQMLLTEANEQLAQRIKQNEEMNEQLRQLAILDELTCLPNRRGLQEYIELALHSRTKNEVDILMIDIDAFKSYNDHYGHLQGDKAIQMVADTLKHCADQGNHLCARFGGEEFILVILGATETDVYSLAEKVRSEVEKRSMPHEYSEVASVVTVSIGVSHGRVYNPRDLEQIIEQADIALYKAKSNGRNQVRFIQERSYVN